MPGCPPRHVCVAERRLLLTYLLTARSATGRTGRTTNAHASIMSRGQLAERTAAAARRPLVIRDTDSARRALPHAWDHANHARDPPLIDRSAPCFTSLNATSHARDKRYFPYPPPIRHTHCRHTLHTGQPARAHGSIAYRSGCLTHLPHPAPGTSFLFTTHTLAHPGALCSTRRGAWLRRDRMRAGVVS